MADEAWLGLVNPANFLCNGPTHCTGKLEWTDGTKFVGDSYMDSLGIEGTEDNPSYYMQYEKDTNFWAVHSDAGTVPRPMICQAEPGQCKIGETRWVMQK